MEGLSWRSLRHEGLALAGLCLLASALAVALLAPWLAPHAPGVPAGGVYAPPGRPIGWAPTTGAATC